MKERSGMPYDVVAYEADELARKLSLSEEGLFHRLLRHAWMNGSIPDSPSEIAHIFRINPASIKKAWPRVAELWTKHPSQPGRLINLKQESERDYVVTKRQLAKEAAEKRWNALKLKKKKNASAMPTQCDGNASPPHPNPTINTNTASLTGSLSADADPPAPKPPTARSLFEAWNRERGPLPEARDLTESRKLKCKTRLAKDPAKFSDDFEAAVRRARASPFILGGKWFTFDWLIENDTNIVKVLEGKYDEARRPASNGRRETAADRTVRESEEYLREEFDETRAGAAGDTHEGNPRRVLSRVE